MRLPPPSMQRPSSGKWKSSRSEDDSRDDDKNSNQHRNTLGDILMNNHDVMNKIVKYDLAARKHAALQNAYIPQDDSINTAEDIKRSLRNGTDMDSFDQRDLPPTPKVNNGTVGTHSRKTRITTTYTNDHRKPSPAPSISSGGTRNRGPSPSDHRKPSPTPSISSGGTRNRVPSPSFTVSSHNNTIVSENQSLPSIQSTAGESKHRMMQTTNFSSGANSSKNQATSTMYQTPREAQHSQFPISAQHSMERRSPDPSFQSYSSARQSPVTDYEFVRRHRSLEHHKSMEQQASFERQRSLDRQSPLTSNAKILNRTSPITMPYNATSTMRMEDMPYIRTHQNPSPNWALTADGAISIPQRSLADDVETQTTKYEDRVKAQAVFQSSPNWDYPPEPSPINDSPQRMKYQVQYVSAFEQNPQLRPNDYTIETTNSIEEETSGLFQSCAGPALLSSTAKRAGQAAILSGASILSSTISQSKATKSKRKSDQAKSKSTPGILDFVKANIPIQAASGCTPTIDATMSSEPREKSKSVLWSILDPTDDLDYTDEDDDDDDDENSAVRSRRGRSSLRNSRRREDRSESPSRQSTRSVSQHSYQEAYDDLMFMSSPRATVDKNGNRKDVKKKDKSEEERPRKSSRKSSKDSPSNRGSRSIHFEEEAFEGGRKQSQGSEKDSNGRRRQTTRQQKVDDKNQERIQQADDSSINEPKGSGRRVRVTEEPARQSRNRSSRNGRRRRKQAGDSDIDEIDQSDSGIEVENSRSRSRSLDHKSRSQRMSSPEEANSPKHATRRRKNRVSWPSSPSSGHQAESLGGKASKSPARSALREGRFNKMKTTQEATNISSPGESGVEQVHFEKNAKSGRRTIVSGKTLRTKVSSSKQGGPTISFLPEGGSRVSALSEDSTDLEPRNYRNQLNRVVCRSVKKDEIKENNPKNIVSQMRIPAHLPGSRKPKRNESFESETSETTPSIAYPRRHHDGARRRDVLDAAMEQCLVRDIVDPRDRRIFNDNSSIYSSGVEDEDVAEYDPFGLPRDQSAAQKDGYYMYVAYSRFGEDAREVIQLCEHVAMPVPNTKASEVLVKVKAASISMSDCEIRRGEWSEVRLSPFIIPGVAFMGQIHKSEKRSPFHRLQPGDMVMSLVKSGSNARYMCAQRDQLIKVPNNLDPAEVVCLAETYLSAFQALHLGHKAAGIRYRGNSLKGNSILILGAGTALGQALIEVALAGGAQHVYATAKEKQFDAVSEIGGIPLTRDPQDWLTLIGHRISTIVCVDCGIYAENVSAEHLKALTRDGQVVIIGPPGIETTAANMQPASHSHPSNLICTSARKRLRQRSQYYNVFDKWDADMNMCKRDLSHLLDLLQRGALRPNVLERIPLAKVAKAQAIVESKRLSGFIVCDPWLERWP